MGGNPETVVAGVGHPDAEDLSLRTALDIGRRSGARVHLVHALEIQPLAGGPPGVDLSFAEEWSRLVPELEAALGEAAGADAAARHVVAGSAGQVICQIAAERRASLVVVGAARAGAVRQAFLGTTAQRVLRTVHVPVLVVRKAFREGPLRVLVTTDLSAESAVVHGRGMVAVGALLGRQAEAARSLVVYAFGFVSPPLPAPVQTGAVREALNDFLAGLGSVAAGVEPAVRAGTAVAREIVAEAAEWNADLLIVGTHARRRSERWILGSVAEACVRDAPCNVLVVPPVAAHRDERIAVPGVLPAVAGAPLPPLPAAHGPAA